MSSMILKVPPLKSLLNESNRLVKAVEKKHTGVGGSFFVERRLPRRVVFLRHLHDVVGMYGVYDGYFLLSPLVGNDQEIHTMIPEVFHKTHER